MNTNRNEDTLSGLPSLNDISNSIRGSISLKKDTSFNGNGHSHSRSRTTGANDIPTSPTSPFGGFHALSNVLNLQRDNSSRYKDLKKCVVVYYFSLMLAIHVTQKRQDPLKN